MKKLISTIVFSVLVLGINSVSIAADDDTQRMQQLQRLLQQTQPAAAPATTQPAATTTAQLQQLAQAPVSQATPAQPQPAQPPKQQAFSMPRLQTSMSMVANPDAGKVPVAALLATDNQTAPSAAAAVVATPTVSQPNLYEQAFDNTINQLVPLSPEQVAKLHEIFNDNQLAATTPPGIPPKPTTTSIVVSLSPQATPPVIRLGGGYITSLVFMDTTGQPWPIEAYSIGDPSSFNIQWDKKGNTLLIQATSLYKRTNLAVMLRDLNTPVMLTLLTGQAAVDYRVDLRVPGLGPNAMIMQNTLPDAANPVLLDVLNGVPPKGSKTLRVSGGDGEAWILNGKLYLRTSLDVISPAWQAVMSSIDGTHAYELQPAPVILALQHGKDKVLRLNVEGLE